MTGLDIVIPKDLEIRLRRMVCPSACPDYSICIYRDGKALYEGRRYVAVKGKQERRIKIDQVRTLVAEFYSIDYFSLKDRYDAIVRDGATTVTSILAGGRTKQVINCHPSLAPEGLYRLEQRIDETAQSHLWVRDHSGEPVLEP